MLAACTMLPVIMTASAAASDGSLMETDFDGATDRLRPITDTLYAGAVLEFSVESAFNPSLGDRADDDDYAIEPELFLKGAWQPSDRIDLIAEVKLTRRFRFNDDRSPELELLLKRAYAGFRDFVPGTILVLGRQSFVDERKWLWEEALDGMRLFWRGQWFTLEAAAARDGLAHRDLLEPRDEDGGNYLWGAARASFAGNRDATLFALLVDGREEENEELLFTGVLSGGDLVERVEYWLDSAVVSGQDGDRDVLGFGIDLGATWQTALPLQPALTLGFALGTGDDGAGTNNAFRQTGLHENSGRFAGLASFDYYGEVLDPELSNLAIMTAGIGLRPMKEISVDLVYHNYHQLTPTGELRDSDVDVDPTGANRALGNALDVIFGWRATDRVSLKASGGAFFPGGAFEPDEPAWTVGAELRIRL